MEPTSDVLLIIAGSLALVAAAVHGAGGEAWVLRKLSAETLPSTTLGGPRMTMAMIHATWHITTVAFLTAGVAMLLAGTTLHGNEARAVAMIAAGAFTGFAAVALGLGFAETGSPRTFYRHPGPAILAITAVLAWLGAV